MLWDFLKSEPWILLSSIIVGLIIVLNIVVVIYHAFLPKAGGGEVKEGESSDYSIERLNKKK